MMGVVEDQDRLAAQHATEYATPTHLTRAGRSAQVLASRREAGSVGGWALDEESVVVVQGESSEWL